jgi:MFS family permease
MMVQPNLIWGFGQPTFQALVVLSITQIIAWGTLFYGMMLLGPRIMAETGWSSGLVYAGFSLALLTAGFAAVKVGGLIDRHGGRPVMSIGALVGGAGFVLLAVSSHPLPYFLSFALIGLGMAGALYDAAFASLARIAGPQSRRAISALTLAGGLASTVFWPVGYWLLTLMDWRMVALTYAGLVGGVCAVLHLLLLPKGRWETATTTLGQSDTETVAEAPPMVGGEARRMVLVIFGAAIIIHGVITNALSVHLAPTLDALGLTEAEAIWAGALIGPSQSAARLIELMFSSRYPVLALGLIASGLMPLAFAVLIGGAFGLKAVLLYAVLYGASNGLITIARGVLPLALFGREGYGRTLGLISGPALVAKSAAPLIFAAMIPWLGASLTMQVLAALSVLCFLAMLALTVLVKRQTRV